MKAWKTENAVNLKPTYIGNHDDIQAKIKAGGGSYDLITYYQGYKDLYTELDILTTIDTDKIPNIEGLFPVFKEADSPQPVDRRGRRLDGRAVDVRLDRHHLGRQDASWRARVVVRPARREVQGQGRRWSTTHSARSR